MTAVHGDNWVFDFETNNDAARCSVWAWAACDVENPDEVEIGNRIETFMSFAFDHGGTFYAHNARFDFDFIANWLFRSGFVCDDSTRPGTFSLLMSDTGKFYCARLYPFRGYTVEIRDSYKKLTASVRDIARMYNLDESKGEIDYNAYHEPGTMLTVNEAEYVRNDVVIVARALKAQFDEEMFSLTAGADALKRAKRLVGRKNWKKYFPVLDLETDATIRKAYRGGWTYASDYGKGVHGRGISLDVNSMYPSCMKMPLPVGRPHRHEGRYTGNRLYIARLIVTARLKPGHLPCLQIKKSLWFGEHEYVRVIDEPTEIYCTNVDLELLFAQYDVKVYQWVEAMSFDQCTGIFDEYIDTFMEIKANSTGAARSIAKLFLNSLYGKLATNPIVRGKTCYLDDGGVVRYVNTDAEERDPVYTAAAAFVTSYARRLIVTSAQRCGGRFLYADTDSLKLEGTEVPGGLDIDRARLGAWKHEGEFERIKIIGAKCYMVDWGEKGTEVRCAGLDQRARGNISFDEFAVGLVVPGGKLTPKHVPGGTVLVESDFTIKGR